MSDFRLLRGGEPDSLRLGGPRLAVVCRNEPPFAVDARVVEDDTWLVLGADPAYREPTEHPLRVMTAAHEAEPAAPGSVIVRSGEPLRFHAVVHDLARSPTWTETWVTSALRGVFAISESRRLRSLALPVLGGHHGSLEIDRFLPLLAAALEAARPTYLERLWLRVTQDQAARVAGWRRDRPPTEAG